MLDSKPLGVPPSDPATIHRIETFDPKDENEPTRNTVPLDGILARARMLLKRRSADEIHAGIELINWLLRAPDYLRRGFGHFTAGADVPPVGPDATVRWLVQSDVVALARCVDFLAVPQTRTFPDPRWHELFAILALCYVDQVLREERARAAGNDESSGDDDSRRLWTSFSLARQAISLAEQLAEEAHSADQPRTKTRNPFRESLKSLVIATAREKHGALSKRKAGFAVFKDLEDAGRIRYSRKTGELHFDRQHVLTNDDPAHRFSIWIGKARKKQAEQ